MDLGLLVSEVGGAGGEVVASGNWLCSTGVWWKLYILFFLIYWKWIHSKKKCCCCEVEGRKIKKTDNKFGR
jgi:hypothetical protein